MTLEERMARLEALEGTIADPQLAIRGPDGTAGITGG